MGVTFEQIISLWPSRPALAADLGVEKWTADKWWSRKAIPADHWPALLKAAGVRGFALTADDLITAQSNASEAAA